MHLSEEELDATRSKLDNTMNTSQSEQNNSKNRSALCRKSSYKLGPLEGYFISSRYKSGDMGHFLQIHNFSYYL